MSKTVSQAQQHDTAARVKVLVQELNIMLRKASREGVTVTVDVTSLATVGADYVQLQVKTFVDIGDEPGGVLA